LSEEAIKMARHARIEDPTSYLAQSNLAAILKHNGHAEESLEIFRKLQSISTCENDMNFYTNEVTKVESLVESLGNSRKKGALSDLGSHKFDRKYRTFSN
jgi:hypothetical protein